MKSGFVLLISCCLLSSTSEARDEEEVVSVNASYQEPRNGYEAAYEKYWDAFSNWNGKCNKIGVRKDKAKCEELERTKDILAIQLVRETLMQEAATSNLLGLERAADLARDLEATIRSHYYTFLSTQPRNLAMVNTVLDGNQLEFLQAEVRRLENEVKAIRPDLDVKDHAWKRILQDLKEVATVPEARIVMPASYPPPR